MGKPNGKPSGQPKVGKPDGQTRSLPPGSARSGIARTGMARKLKWLDYA